MTGQTRQLTVFRCEMCGKALPDGRKDRKTCNDACRKRLSYHRKRIPALTRKVQSATYELLQYMSSVETCDAAQQAIALLLNDIKATARQARVQEVR